MSDPNGTKTIFLPGAMRGRNFMSSGSNRTAGDYERPQGSGIMHEPVNLWMLILAVVLTTISAAIYVAIFLTGAGFQDLFKGFGAELPALTRFFLSSYQYYGVLILIGLPPCLLLLWNQNRVVAESNRLFSFVFASFGLSLFVLGVSVAATYLPIFQVGAAV